ncbi:MAG: DUF362 domain-containing protein [Prolixibacteraceae bacterium]|nr:DUF362 domain-containing protein [Prolixibacteraceae bacterium]
MNGLKFNISGLKGKWGDIQEWMNKHHLPPKMLFILTGIFSTIWFLVRVIPKPTRATYPCMKVAAPFMSGFVTYLLAVAGLVTMSRKLKRKINVRLGATVFLLFGVLLVIGVTNSTDVYLMFQDVEERTGPIDGPNQPMGEAKGIFPGRVVWVYNPDATNENFEHNSLEDYDFFWSEKNNNPEVINKMFSDGIMQLAGEKTLEKSWDAIFKHFNEKKLNKKKGYTKGEKIFIKLNHGQANWVLSKEDKENGYILSPKKEGDRRNEKSMTPTENGPYVVLELLRELVNVVGVNQEDIYLGDPMNPTYGHNYNAWVKEFPNVKYIDRTSTDFGRTMINFTEEPLLFYSDKKNEEKLYDIIKDADYMILLPVLKPHGAAGISITAKLNFGSIGNRSAHHLHYSHIANRREGIPTNTGYGKYRVFVDMMGSKYLGQNTLIYIAEALFGGGSSELAGPIKYHMPPFNNDWLSSLFMSLDPVAIESVGYDFLRTEFDGVKEHDPANNEWEGIANMFGVDDYMHQAADAANWPEDIQYDPDNSGTPLSSLGVHEHWNNPVDKQYSRNLKTGDGIQLISVPTDLVKNVN